MKRWLGGGVIRVIRVIRLIRDSDADGRARGHRPYGLTSRFWAARRGLTTDYLGGGVRWGLTTDY